MNRQETSAASPSQSAIHLKAYAMARRLEPYHWDNCKITYARQSARAYAEQALREGHSEEIIIQAYCSALRYCHGLITDQINRRERHPGEKGDPALTIYLARKRLQKDGKYPDQRWAGMIPLLEAKRREKADKDARVWEEAAQQAPEAIAWFAQHHAAVSNGGLKTMQLQTVIP